ncbi:MAG: hypothetical protein ABEI06_07480 [Halobacteriaceae archaeon]
MSDEPHPSSEQPGPEPTTQRDELRTISFRMREIQRLLSIRVEQENRKLEAEGIEPVTEDKFREEDSDT